MLKVLLVDDDAIVLNGLKAMLHWERFHGVLVGEARDGEEALRLSLENEPDVVVADIMMPIMDGLELARQLHEQLEGVQIYLLSGHDDFAYAQKAIHCGVAGYILKPVTREKITQLEHMLEELFNAREFQKQLYQSIWDKGMEEEILTALRSCDFDYFEALFRSPLFSARESINSIVNLSMWMINCLYTFFEQIRVEPSIIKTSKDHFIEEFMTTQGKQNKLDFVYQKYCDVMQNINHQKNADTDSLLTDVRQYVDDNFIDPNFNVSYLAEQMNISIPYLSATFRREMGVNLSTYIITLRIDFAKKLLADSRDSVAAIASQIGYADAHYFAKLFKKQTGYTPTEYRNLSIQSGRSLPTKGGRAHEY